MNESLTAQLRAPRGMAIHEFDAAATTGYPGKGKDDVADALAEIEPLLSEQQEKLFAEGRTNPESAPSILLVLQGMDTSGKGGVIRHSIGMVDPQGVHIKAFKAPTEEERQHDFLWRIRKEVPPAGMIGIFDRSHYEDVLIARVNNLVDESVWRARYDEINAFEAELAAKNVHVVKCFLHVSRDEQKKRLEARLDDPTKYWKYNPSDLESRSHWDEYVAAYTDAINECNPDSAPWLVIPSDRKWYRNWAVSAILLETLTSMGLDWPKAEFDVATERQKVASS